MSVQEQAVQMISSLSDENVRYLVDFMKRFMLPKDDEKSGASIVQLKDSVDIMKEMEDMRERAKRYFPSDFDADAIWEEAMCEKYGGIN